MSWAKPADLVPPRYERLIGDKAGLIPTLRIWLRERGDPGFATVEVLGANYGVLDGVGTAPPGIGAGKQRDIRTAVRAALGEAVERYAILVAPLKEEMRWTTHDRLAADESVIDYEYLVSWGQDRTSAAHVSGLLDRPLGEQRPSDGERLFSRQVECFWIPGKDLLSGETRYVPAQLALDVASQHDVPKRWRWTTSGCAAGPTLEFATCNALSEAIERDAILTSWLLQRGARPIEVGRYPTIRELIDAVENDAYAAHLFEIESSCDLPVVGCSLVKNRDEFPKFCMAADAAISPEDAMRGAILEVQQGFPHRIMDGASRIEDVDLEGTVFDDFEKHEILYGQPEHFEHVKLYVDDESVARTDLEEYDDTADANERTKLATLLEIAAKADLTPIALDLTPRDVEDVGLKVVRVIVPELLPFSAPSFPPVYHPKLDGEPVETKPHPFP